MNLEEWRSLIEHWQNQGKKLHYLGIPEDVARALNIQVEQKQQEESGMTEVAQHEPVGGVWKRKKHFDGTQCGLKDCTRKPDGYICDTKPTKDNKNGRVWYGPACQKCVTKINPSLQVTTLAELARQRNGASDLATVLDIEVGEVKRRLAGAGLDEKGNIVEDMTNSDHHPPAAVEQPSDALAVAPGTAIVVPTAMLQAQEQEAAGFATYLANWHIMDQASMDTAAAWLNGWQDASGARVLGLKARFTLLDDMRKDIVRPWQEKVKEVQAFFKPALDALSAAEKLLKQRIAEGQSRAEEAQRMALQAAQQAHQQGSVQQVSVYAQQAAQADVTLPAGVSMRSVLRFEVQDPSQVPAQLWSPDPAKIQAAIDAGYTQIPGVRIWEEQIVAGRRY